jgi:hypothetical protein
MDRQLFFFFSPNITLVQGMTHLNKGGLFSPSIALFLANDKFEHSAMSAADGVVAVTCTARGART